MVAETEYMVVSVKPKGMTNTRTQLLQRLNSVGQMMLKVHSTTRKWNLAQLQLRTFLRTIVDIMMYYLLYLQPIQS